MFWQIFRSFGNAKRLVGSPGVTCACVPPKALVYFTREPFRIRRAGPASRYRFASTGRRPFLEPPGRRSGLRVHQDQGHEGKPGTKDLSARGKGPSGSTSSCRGRFPSRAPWRTASRWRWRDSSKATSSAISISPSGPPATPPARRRPIPPSSSSRRATSPCTSLPRKSPIPRRGSCSESLAMISGRLRATHRLIAENAPWVRELNRQIYTDPATGMWSRAFLDEEVPRLHAPLRSFS